MTSLSFEFFPPKSLEASFRLWETVRTLSGLDPRFVSVTYGAGGATRDLTHDAVRTIHRHYGLNVAAHLTCVDASRSETMEIAHRYAEAGVREIVALRGDPPRDRGAFRPHPDGFRDSAELVAALAATGKFRIHVGAYPDPHPEARRPGADIDWLKRKVDAGATSAITQFFFEADSFLRFRDAAVAAGIDVPLIPGILPVENWAGTKAFAARSGAVIPKATATAFDRATREGRADLLALVTATELCNRLIRNGVPQLHFYTLNRPTLTRDVVHALGLVPEPALENVA